LPSVGSMALVPQMDRHPAFQGTSAPEILERVLDQGVAWLGQTDLPTIVLLRQVLEKRDQVEATDLKMWVELTKTAHQLMAQCGFDPASRSKLGLAEVSAKSKLEKLRERRDSNTAPVGDSDQPG
jgi:hypothetical protein